MKSLATILEGQTFSFLWKDATDVKTVHITLPERLESLIEDSWGDWGPMYTLVVQGDDTIKLSFNGEETQLKAKSLTVESPILAKEREEHPYMLRFHDQERDLISLLYLTSALELDKAEIFRASDRIELGTCMTSVQSNYEELQEAQRA